MVADVDREAFSTNGYVIARSVFSPEEVDRFRRRLKLINERSETESAFDSDSRYPELRMLHGDPVSMPELRDLDYVVLDKRIVELVRKLLGTSVTYHGDGSVQIGEGPRGFHKDNADRASPEGIDWRGTYGLLRLGIYLQDHQHSSGGLKVRKRSHRYVSHHRGWATNLSTRAGDVVFWYLTTSHSGNAIRLKGFPRLCLHPRLESLIPEALCLPESAVRMAIFCTFGSPGAHLQRYIEYQRSRPEVLEHWRRCGIGPEIDQLAARRDVALLQPSEDYGQLFKNACSPQQFDYS